MWAFRPTITNPPAAATRRLYIIYSSFLIPKIRRSKPLNAFGLFTSTTFIKITHHFHNMYQPQRKKVIASSISATQSRNITAQSGKKLAAISPAVNAKIIFARFLFLSLLNAQALALIMISLFRTLIAYKSLLNIYYAKGANPVNIPLYLF